MNKILYHVRRIRHLNRLGLSFIVIYLALTLLFVFFSIDADPKGRFVMLQIPITLQLAVVDLLGLADYTQKWSFPVAYAIFIPAACLFLYASGVALSRAWTSSTFFKWFVVAIVLAPWIINIFIELFRAIFL